MSASAAASPPMTCEPWPIPEGTTAPAPRNRARANCRLPAGESSAAVHTADASGRMRSVSPRIRRMTGRTKFSKDT